MFSNESRLIWLYAGFAFLVSMIRELVKDLEDIEGDAQDGCRTLPVVAGIKIVRTTALLLSAGSLLLLGFVTVCSATSLLIQGYVLFLVAIPWCIAMRLIWKADNSLRFHEASNVLKLVMLTGILSMAVLQIPSS